MWLACIQHIRLLVSPLVSTTWCKHDPSNHQQSASLTRVQQALFTSNLAVCSECHISLAMIAEVRPKHHHLFSFISSVLTIFPNIKDPKPVRFVKQLQIYECGLKTIAVNSIIWLEKIKCLALTFFGFYILMSPKSTELLIWGAAL